MQVFASNLAKRISERIGEERGPPTLRLSNLGTKCERQLWYRINAAASAQPFPPEARFKFLFGDVIEELVLWLAKQAGHEVVGEQDAVELHGVTGHRDAVVDGTLVDVKSASSYSFAKFKDGLEPAGDSFGYLTQLDGYLHASTDLPVKDVAAFIAVDKTLGKICVDKHKKSSVNYSKVVQQKKEMLAKPEPPPRGFEPEPFGKSGNMKLGVNCSYCEHKFHCHKNLRAYAYSTGPVYLTKVVREPDVPQI